MNRSLYFDASIRILIKSILLFLFLGSGSVSAFNLGSVRAAASPAIRSVPLYAKKPTKMSGIGGMPGPKPTIGKSKPTKVANAKTSNTKPTKNGTAKSVFDRPKISSETPWSSILVAFLNPLRNPNSLFLYLLLIVSVLGKLNENNVGN
jgi:hypothetical protein